MGSSLSDAGQTLKKMPGALKDDIRMGLTNKFDSPEQEADYRVRTKDSMDLATAPSQEDDKPVPRQSTMARAAAPTVSSSGVAPVASAPDLPNPDVVGETEQALLNANRKGRSSMIATSPAGLLAGEDSTAKRRSLIGSLIR